jgi:hypothetical protein
LDLLQTPKLFALRANISIASRLKADDPQFVKAINFSIPLDSMSYELQIKKRGTTPAPGKLFTNKTADLVKMVLQTGPV